jgi:hypothetical protein
MKYTTTAFIDAVLTQESVLRESFHPQTDQSLLIGLYPKMECSLCYCWRFLRGQQQTESKYNDFLINVDTCAGRTLVTIARGVEYISFAGAVDSIGPGAHALAIDSAKSLWDFATAINLFAEVCTPEMLQQNQALSIQ